MKNGYLLMFLAGQEVKNPLASKLASAVGPFDPGIKSLYYYKNMTISCYNLKKLIFFVIGNDSRNALSDTIPI